MTNDPFAGSCSTSAGFRSSALKEHAARVSRWIILRKTPPPVRCESTHDAGRSGPERPTFESGLGGYVAVEVAEEFVVGEFFAAVGNLVGAVAPTEDGDLGFAAGEVDARALNDPVPG